MTDKKNNANSVSSKNDLNVQSSNRKPLLYALALVVVAVMTYGYKILNHGIFACPADGYQDGWYFAYCNSTAYGDYDHGALWYPLEDETVSNASKADVLMIGSSRMQYGFSTDAVDQWFDQRDVSHFLLGFSHTETVKFVGPLVEKVQPQAKVVIINLDGFFEDRITDPVARIYAGGDSLSRYQAKKRWHKIHETVCGTVPFLCKTSPGVYRNKETGRWIQYGSNPNWKKAPTAIESDEPVDRFEEDLALAREFIQSLERSDRCILLTVVPSPFTPAKKVEYLAQRLGKPLHAPAPLGYRTRDNSHLDIPSAERWSEEYLQQAGSEIDRCLNLSSAPTG